MTPEQEVAAIDLLLELGSKRRGLQPFLDCLYSPYSKWYKLVCSDKENPHSDMEHQRAEWLLKTLLNEAETLGLIRTAPELGDDCAPRPYWHWLTRRTTAAGRVWLRTK